ncbi:MAG: chromosomal replication initiator protein DnaA [Lachnospiraceae bacterium]|nr:chromosomal replication initiator protein DnaA [Lachnospiraceae bacterium]MEE3461760.1 chromosomal replication initiator protein DnaA [Lachnospiraceae bacterium]
MNTEMLVSRWDEILEYLKDFRSLSDVFFNTFIKCIKVHDYTDHTVNFVIDMDYKSLNNQKTLSYIEETYSDFIRMSINVILKGDADPDYKMAFHLIDYYNDSEGNTSHPEAERKEAIAPAAADKTSDSFYINNSTISNKNINHSFINPNYTFDTFISGDENAMVYNACISVAENPGNTTMNPLFIYGKSGLGKTHLMHAIANHIIQHHPEKKVIYVTSEQFTNEIIEAIRRNTGDFNSTKNFRNEYRNVNVLLVDDVQLIVGKEAVQNEFFNTFNALYDVGSQIVLTSDQKPKDLKILNERMSSRFLSGLPVDVKMPQYETRMAILRQKAEENNFKCDNEILDYIANNVSSNIRELQAAMNSVINMVNLNHNKELTLENVKIAIADMIDPNPTKNMTIDSIINAVCSEYKVNRSDILGNKRTADITEPRHLIMYISHKETQSSLQEIGEKLGKRDHATVINGEKKIKKMIEDPDNNAAFIERYNTIAEHLRIKQIKV